MQINKRVALVAAASGACIAAALLAPTASGAASGYTVSKGGAVKVANSGNLVFHDIKANQDLTCTKFAAAGTANKGSHKFVPKTYKSASGLSAAGTLPSKSPTKELTGCSNPLAGATAVTTSGTWALGFSSKSKTGGKGYLYNVSASANAGNGGCKFTATGAVYGTYTNKTGVFAGSTQAGLKLSKVSGSLCGLVGIANGDTAYLKGKVTIKPALTIK